MGQHRAGRDSPICSRALVFFVGAVTRAVPALASRCSHGQPVAGLPQNSVISMTQTRDGYLWVGTLNGLARFDGLRFSAFDESNTPELNASPIVKLFEDSHGNLWIGTDGGDVFRAKA